jgi:type I restriction enzyme S subunit
MNTNWQIKKLSDICDISAGNSAPQKKELFIDGKYPFFRTSDVGVIHLGEIKKSVDYLNEKGIKGLKLFKKDTILLPKSGASTFLNHRVIMTVDGYVSSHLATIKTNEKELNYKFLYYLLREIKAQDLIQDHRYPSLNLSIIENIDISFPSLVEQKRIVKILDDVFNKLEIAKNNAEKNLKNSKILFKSYLQNIFNNSSDEWENKRIIEVCELKSGTTIPISLERREGDVLYTKIADMNLPENLVEINTSSRFVDSNEIKMNQIIPDGAVVFPKRGGAIATNKKRKIVKPTIVDLNTMAIIPGKKIDNDYFYHWFKLIDLNDISNGTSIPQINNYSFDEVYISYPISLSEQKTIVKKLDELSDQTKKLEVIYKKKLADLEELKKSVLKKAFTGML